MQEVADAAAWAAVAGPGHAGPTSSWTRCWGPACAQQPTGLVAQAIADLAAWCRARGTPVVAVDIPSGLPSDSGEVAWPTRATPTVTVTFAAPKYGHVLPPACDRVGELVVADIGIPSAVLRPRPVAAARRRTSGPPIRRAPASAHKGTFGHVLVVAGSVGKTGAAVLAAGGGAPGGRRAGHGGDAGARPCRWSRRGARS